MRPALSFINKGKTYVTLHVEFILDNGRLPGRSCAARHKREPSEHFWPATSMKGCE
jgi:hypothetical protein